jgi:hypothetical protein
MTTRWRTSALPASADPALAESTHIDKLTVLELYDLVEQLEKKYGVSAEPIRDDVTATQRRDAAKELGEAVTHLSEVLARTVSDSVIAREIASVHSRALSRGSTRRALTHSRAERNAAEVRSLRETILGDALSSDEVRGYVRRSRPIVNKMAKDGRLLAIADGRALRFPRWQFDLNSETGVVPGLVDVLATMDASPFRKAAWLVTTSAALSDTPLNALRSGRIASVLDEAKSVVSS